MSFADQLYDLLFEISSEERHKILRYLSKKTANLTSISKNVELNLPETRRHLQRLLDVDLILRTPNGDYILTNLGEIILEKISEITFFTEYKEYFETHTLDHIPSEFRSRLGDLSNSVYETNVLSFIHRIEEIIKNAEKEIVLIVDQFPVNYASLIIDAIKRGVKVKILEPEHQIFITSLSDFNQDINPEISKQLINRGVNQKTLQNPGVFIYASENDYALTFPTIKNAIDYIGFLSKGGDDQKWVNELFQYLWEKSEPRYSVSPKKESTDLIEKQENITVEGKARPEYDVKAIQDAVDNYSQVILKGVFNIGNSTITVKNSVVISGEGRNNDVPDTKIYKQGWNFPFIEQAFLFAIRGEDIDVTIENIHFENFNGTCIGSFKGNSAIIKKNRITLLSGHGRGLSFGKWGDHVVGITMGGEMGIGGFPGGIVIEDNYLDFALSYTRGGFISPDGAENKPDYRPDLRNHEAPICIGMNICRNLGKVVVRNNVIKNMSSRGIYVFDNADTSEIEIYGNEISSDVFGAYPYNSPMAGVGLFIQSAWSEIVSGGKVEAYSNHIVCSKVNYCGVAVHGPSIYRDGVGKLEKCVLRDNVIELQDGYLGIQVRKSDNVSVINNKFTGKAYYGVQISGLEEREGINLSSCGNVFKDNAFDEFVVKPTDYYSDSMVDGYTFTGNESKSETSIVWLAKHSRNNKVFGVKVSDIIDEGSENQSLTSI